MLQTPARAITWGLTRPSARSRLRVRLLPYLLLSPSLLLLVGLAAYPLFNAIEWSLYNANLIRLARAEFVGLANYWKAVSDRVVTISALQTARLVGVVIAGQLGIALPVALFLNLKFPLRGLVRTAVLVPWVLPPAVNAFMWVFMFDSHFGVVNDLLVRMRILSGYLSWMSEPGTSFFVLAMAMIWAGFPFMAIVLLAALQAIPEEMYEAARVDGANAWRRFLHITLPLLRPTILLLVLLRAIWLSHHVDMIFIMTNGGPGFSNYTVSLYSFLLTSSQLEVGYASAIAVILGGILLVGTALSSRRIRQAQEGVA